MDGQTEGMPRDEVPVTHAGQDVERAVDGQGYDGKLEFVGQGEGALAELSHVASETAGTFREYGDGIAFVEYLAGIVIGFLDLADAALVDHDLVGLAAGVADEGYLVDLVLHHPLEIAVQEAINEEDVEGALMVGHEDVGLVFLQMLTAFDLDGEQQGADNNLTPPMAGIVAPEMAIADGTANTHFQGGDDGGNDEHWHSDQDLIDEI